MLQNRAQMMARRSGVGTRMCAGLMITCALAACHADAAPEHERAIVWRSDSNTTWLAFDTIPDFQIAPTGGFAVAGDDLWVADLRGNRVAGLHRVNGAWKRGDDLPPIVRLRGPRTMAVVDDGRTLAILDSRDQLFLVDAGTGATIQVAPERPCRAYLSQLIAVRDGPGRALLLTGECRLRASSDTMSGIAAVSTDSGRHFRLLAHLPRYAVDGSWGRLLGARHFVSTGREGLAFGTGYEPCLQIYDPATFTHAKDDCALPSVRYAGDAPPEWKQATMQREFHMRSPSATQWPQPLIPYLDRIDVPAGHVFARLVRTTTLELQVGDTGGGLPLVAAPVDGFRGCIPDGCLWMTAAGNGTAVRLLRPSEIEAMAAAAHDRRLRTASVVP